MHQLGELLAKLRRVRRSVFSHLGLLWFENHKVSVKWGNSKLRIDRVRLFGGKIVFASCIKAKRLNAI